MNEGACDVRTTVYDVNLRWLMQVAGLLFLRRIVMQGNIAEKRFHQY